MKLIRWTAGLLPTQWAHDFLSTPDARFPYAHIRIPGNMRCDPIGSLPSSTSNAARAIQRVLTAFSKTL